MPPSKEEIHWALLQLAAELGRKSLGAWLGAPCTLSQAFDLCEEVNGKGSTVLLAEFNSRGADEATIDSSDPRNVKIRVGDRLAGMSRRAE